MTTTGYKLTDADMRTHSGYQWALGKTPTPCSGKGPLCTSGWFHYYLDPILAVLLDPIHAGIGAEARLFRAEVGGEILHDRGLKAGCTEMTLVEELPVPTITIAQRVLFAQKCAAFAAAVAREPRMEPEMIAARLVQCATEAMKESA